MPEVDARPASGTPSSRRPGMATAAAVVLGVMAVLELAFLGLFMALLAVGGPGPDARFAVGVQSGVSHGSLAIVAALAAVLVAKGREAGRALAFGVAGIACWSGVGSLASTVTEVVSGSQVSEYVVVFPGLAVGALGLSLILMLGNRRTAMWFHELRTGSPRVR